MIPCETAFREYYNTLHQNKNYWMDVLVRAEQYASVSHKVQQHEIATLKMNNGKYFKPNWKLQEKMVNKWFYPTTKDNKARIKYWREK